MLINSCFLLALIFNVCAFSEDSKPPVPLFVPAENNNAKESILPLGWKTIHGKNTDYAFINNDSGPYLHAIAASGNRTIGKQLALSINNYTVLAWRWKIIRFPTGAREDIKNKNDSPAGVYVLFKDGFFFKSLKYVWSDTLPVGTAITSQYNSSVKIIVLETGAGKTGQWVAERVNFKNDMERYVGKKLSEIKGVGILTDADNTRSRAEACYDSLTLLPQ